MLDNNVKGAVLALGFFDSVHLGHQSVINRARELAKKLNSKTVVITFEGNLKKQLFGEKEKTIYSMREREVFFKQLGVDEIFFAPLQKDFLSLTKSEFLDFLNSKYLVKGYVCGLDYHFGIKGEGDKDFLTEYALKKGQEVIITPTSLYNDQKISTSLIKEYLSKGDIKTVNTLLGRSYSIFGEVFRGRKVGSVLGFPTLNIKVDSDRFMIKEGVYCGRAKVQDKEYLAIINYGGRPTFNLYDTVLEAHLIGFSDNVYGQKITLIFDEFMRDIRKFNSPEELKTQLQKDLSKVKNI